MQRLATDDETELIVRSQRGDVIAFNQLILYYQQSVYRTAYRIVGDPDVAADVTQDAFIAAFRNIHTYRNNASFRAWLLRIGSNMACDYWRRTQRHPVESLDGLADEDDSHSVSFLNTLATTDAESDPEAYSLTKELQELLQQGIQQLPLDQRTALVLCDIEGLSYEEIATATQTSLGTVRSRISRGRARLRDYLYRNRELLPRNYRLSNSEQDH
jgi:RNA polymerase sigma-70 factor (ECF subfamily)